MSNGSSRCRCPRCTIRNLLGPAVVITVGVLFLLQEVRGGAFEFSNTYPFILMVIGGILLGSAIAPMTGHIEPTAPPAAVAATSGRTTGTPPGSITGPGR
jgi:hypothetical protein